MLSAVTDIKRPFTYHLDSPHTSRFVRNTYCQLENLQVAPRGRQIRRDHLLFTQVETEALRGVVTGPASHSQKVLEQGSLAPSLASFIFQIGFESALRKSLNAQLISLP